MDKCDNNNKINITMAKAILKKNTLKFKSLLSEILKVSVEMMTHEPKIARKSETNLKIWYTFCESWWFGNFIDNEMVLNRKLKLDKNK